MDLHLILSGECNLACGYCYQDARRSPGPMCPEIAEAAVQNVLTAGEPPHRVILSGGEPFLARDLVRRLIRALREGPQTWGMVECAVLSNGTLVSDADIEALAAADVELQLSFDGVEAAQSRRMPGTFGVLDRLVTRAFELRPSWARRRLTVQMMVQGETVSTLAASVRSHVERGISEIGVECLDTHDPGWTGATRRRLEQEVDTIVGDSLEHHGRTGAIPVAFLRKRAPRVRRSSFPRTSPFVCGAPSGTNVTVDPDGRAWTCPAFVPSIQRLPPLGRDAAAALHLGDVRSPELPRRLADLPRRAGCVPLLRTSPERRSSRGRCRDCEHAPECLVCPASTCFVPGNRDPHWVPDNQCDVQWATLDARRRFQGHLAAVDLLREIRRRTRRLRSLARSAPGVSPGGPAGA